MQPEMVNEILKNYKMNMGRCRYLETQIQETELKLQKTNAIVQEDSGAPNGVQARPPSLAPNGDNASLLEKLAQMRMEYQVKHTYVLYVQAWLSGLNEKEKWLIEAQVIEGNPWAKIAVDLKRLYGLDRGQDSLKKLKTRVMEKIYEIAI